MSDDENTVTEPLVGAEHVAQYLQMSLDWVYAKSRKGVIPTVRLGRYYRYRMSAISRWVEDNERAFTQG